MNVADDAVPAERSRGAFLSAHAFRLLGARPVLGRDFDASDEVVGAASVAILSHTLWRGRYRADGGVIGRTIRINGAAATVVGVMPEGFEFPTNARLWQPLSQLPADLRDDRRARFAAFARLAPEATVTQARAELRAVMDRLAQSNPDSRRQQPPNVEPFRSGIGGPIVALMAALMGAVTFVLLIACANVANLLLARAALRAREVSVRMSIGASRWRIVRQLLAESLLLACLGGIVGLALSAAGIRLFWRVVSEVGNPPPFWMSFPLDLQVFAFLAVVCLGTSILFGLVPALHTSRTRIAALVNDTGQRTLGARGSRRWAGGLVIAQLALALVLLTGAGVMMQRLVTLVTMDAGVDTSRLVSMAIELPAPRYTSEQRLAFYRQLDERLRTTAGLQGALASVAPMGGAPAVRILLDAHGDVPEERRPTVSLVRIGPGYFDTLDATGLRGATLPDNGGGPEPPSALVNERFAEMHFPAGDAIGSRLRIGADADWTTIAGIVPNVRQRTTESGAFDPVVYVALYRDPPQRVTVLARSESGPSAVGTAITAYVSELSKDVPVYDIRTVDEGLAISRWPQRVFGSLFVIFSVVALILAAIGLYAVTAYSVSQRTREIGLRMALGARPRQVMALMMRRAFMQLGAGLLLGGAGALAVSRVLPAMLAGSGGADSATLLLVSGLLIAVGIAAAWLPSRRATQLDPISALRTD